ncbi:hypothetical protein LAZ67_17001232 [Cordylochernes scorpioides]|uniref:Uncharacterized protein n=1 Tax=Cordylochernes scorpioides TaxID=51811 RepID=A0ABY6LG06_9ARAC|nr:hypothetical protein LAZ67_17001232 [Cordylochernes scorpioides]
MSMGWVIRHGLDDDALAILASAKTRIYRYFLDMELSSVQEDLVWRRTLSRNDVKVSSPALGAVARKEGRLTLADMAPTGTSTDGHVQTPEVMSDPPESFL